MNITPLKVSKTLNDAYRKQSLTAAQVSRFKQNLSILFHRINDAESEEYNKNIIADFLKDTYYKGLHEINTNERKDLVIHNGPKASDPVGVIIEAKKPGNKAEMITAQKPNVKALHELLHYYLQERLYKNNTSIKYLIATNVYDWFVFDAQDFEKLFFENKALLKDYKDWNDGTLVGDKTEWLYNQLLKPFIDKQTDNLNAAYFNLKDALSIATNNNEADDEQLVDLYKIFSGEHLLKKSFANDSNSLNKEFYNELLHIIGLEEKKDGSKKLIDRKPEGKRNEGSLLENTITILQSRSRIGLSDADTFSVALELCINWLNRILFLKLLEGQLIQYHRGNKNFAFLNGERIKDFDELDELFFEVLALPVAKRSPSVTTKFANIPYLNSSLFEATDNEQRYGYISALKDRLELPLYSATVLKDNSGKRIAGNKNSLQYLFEFLDAYDFASDKASLVKEDNKTIINASVLGLIFEKINGYKDGSFFTPGFITMYMCRETLRRAVVQKFKEAGGKAYEKIDGYEALKDAIEYSNKTERTKANSLIDSIKICDPAVGSGHFLVSALNELLAIKSDLRILSYRNGNRCSSHKITVANDELIIKNVETDKFFVYLLNEKNQPIEELQEVQEMLFHEKQTLIENCLFGVDINPKSVMICQLRLWIELLKNAYYVFPTSERNLPGSSINVGQVPHSVGNDSSVGLETLPNIDINIKCGNSLISRFKLDADLSDVFKSKRFSHQAYLITVEAYKNAKDKAAKDELKTFLSDIKKEFLSTVLNKHPYQKDLSRLRADLTALDFTDLFGLKKMTAAETEAKKKTLQKQIAELENKVDEYYNAAIYNNAFEWRFEFPEVLDGDGNYKGFDVVIGNPPYIRQEEISDIKNYLKQQYEVFAGTADLLVYFIEKGMTILKQEGQFNFIVANKFLRAGFGKVVRKWIQQFQINALIDFGDLPVFDEATTYPLVMLLQKKLPVAALMAANIKELDKENFESYLNEVAFKIHQNNLEEDGWNLAEESTNTLLQKLKKVGKPLHKYAEDNVYRGLLTGLNEAFVIDTETKNKMIAEDEKSKKLVVPFLIGKDIKRYTYPEAKQWLIKIPKGFTIKHNLPPTDANYLNEPTPRYGNMLFNEAWYWLKENYPAIAKHLHPFSAKAEARTDKGDFWWELRACDYYNEFEKPKIIYPNICRQPEFIWDEKGYYSNQKCFIITNASKYLLAVLNSSLTFYLFRQILPKLRGDFYEPSYVYFKDFPIAEATRKQQQQIEAITDKILSAKKQNPKADTSGWEKEIDALVYQLYGLTEEEVRMVEG